MKLLFVHQNLPAQFTHLINHFADDPSHQVVGICQSQAPAATNSISPRCAVRVYQPHREPTKGIHNYLYSTEAGVLNGQAVASEIHQLEKAGFRPDITIVHPGWGEALYIKDVLPDRPLVGFFEFFYRARGLDCHFDPEFPISKDDELRLRTRNAVHLLSLDACDAGVSPNQWQKSAHPIEYHHKLSVIHEGVDTEKITPDPLATFTLPDGRKLSCDDEIVTFVARNLEPYRGFHTFIRAVPEICRRRPHCQILIAGSDGVSYGRAAPEGSTWREHLTRELEIDASRVHFLGTLQWGDYLRLLQISTVHIYLTVPFVLSWSMIEAMAAGAVVIGSDTPPVREVIQHGNNGVLVDFFSPNALAESVDMLCENPVLRRSLSVSARETAVRRYDTQNALERYTQLFHALLEETG